MELDLVGRVAREDGAKIGTIGYKQNAHVKWGRCWKLSELIYIVSSSPNIH
jgi:hypothetical protein